MQGWEGRQEVTLSGRARHWSVAARVQDRVPAQALHHHRCAGLQQPQPLPAGWQLAPAVCQRQRIIHGAVEHRDPCLNCPEAWLKQLFHPEAPFPWHHCPFCRHPSATDSQQCVGAARHRRVPTVEPMVRAQLQWLMNGHILNIEATHAFSKTQEYGLTLNLLWQ